MEKALLKNFIKYILKEEILKESYQLSPKDINFLKNLSLSDVEKIKNFLESRGLRKFGEGSSRIVYGISTSKVLKLAKDEKGLKQNETELYISLNPSSRQVVSKIFDNHQNGLWLISEAVQEFTNKSQFLDMVGIENSELKAYFYQCKIQQCPTEELMSMITSEHPGKSLNLEFISNLYNVVSSGDLNIKDLRVDHFGKTYDGRIVLLDYGMSSDVMRKFY